MGMPRCGFAEAGIHARCSENDRPGSATRTFRSFVAGANLCSQLPHFRSNRKLSVVRALEGVGEIPAGKSLVTICDRGGGRSTEGAVMLEKLGHPDAL